MKPEVFVQKQFEAAQEQWTAEKYGLQAEIISLKERLVGSVLSAKPVAKGAQEVKREENLAADAKFRETKNAALAEQKANREKKAAKSVKTAKK